jgi:hypothetical protein
MLDFVHQFGAHPLRHRRICRVPERNNPPTRVMIADDAREYHLRPEFVPGD